MSAAMPQASPAEAKPDPRGEKISARNISRRAPDFEHSHVFILNRRLRLLGDARNMLSA